MSSPQTNVDVDVAPNSATIVIPVKNGLPHFAEVLRAVQKQDYAGEFEVLVIDSGSADGSKELALEMGVRFVEIEPKDFGHGVTRNFGAEISNTEFVCYLTHDAIPADKDWLSNLLAPMIEDERVAGVFSRHIAHVDGDPFVRKELEDHFAGLATWPVVEITDREEYDKNLGLRQVYHFYSDNSSALRKSIWKQYPYPDVEFAEDQIWAQKIVEAGFKKAYAENSVVRHSHSFGPWETLQRSYDEARAFRVLFGYSGYQSLRHVFLSGTRLCMRDTRDAFTFGWWKSHPLKTLSRIPESFARPLGGFLGAKEDLPKVLEDRLSRDNWIKNL